ncbi:MAG: hypothetical protein GXP31_05900 [Kiritimatiellaeota bacterium]|nr:hypothetical protein [Kiritimatiellota bacterium]
MHRYFTLIELLVASAILVLLLGLLFAAGNGITQSWSRIRAEERRFEEVMELDRTLDNIFSNTIPFHWRDDDGNPVLMFRGEPESVRLTYWHTPNAPDEGALRFVTLKVQDGGLLACYTDRPRLAWEESNGDVQESILAEKVAGIDFQYADWESDNGIVWVSEWDPDAARQDIPLAIMVTLHWEDGRRESWLRRTAGNSQFERWGNPPRPITTRRR